LFLERNVEIDDDGILTATHQHAFELLTGICVHLLMRHEWRNEDEIARPGFGYELEAFAQRMRARPRTT